VKGGQLKRVEGLLPASLGSGFHNGFSAMQASSVSPIGSTLAIVLVNLIKNQWGVLPCPHYATLFQKSKVK
jgi:hypothetical protein